MKIVDWIVLGLLIGATSVFVPWLFHVKEAAPSIPAPVTTVAPEPPKIDRSEEERAYAQASERKSASIERCEKQGGTAAVGFGTTVVCVKAMWVEDPKFPPWRSSPPK